MYIDEKTRQKALEHMQTCRFCGENGRMKPILSEDPAVVLSYECEICGSIATLQRDDHGDYHIVRTVPEKEEAKETLGMCKMVMNLTAEEMNQLISSLEADTVRNAYARSMCNEALRIKGLEPVF